MRVGAVIALVICAALAPAVASAQTPPNAASLYNNGDYEGAIRAGEAQANADGLVIAAEAAIAAATVKDGPCSDCYKRAESLARRAIAADPKRARPYVFLVVALSHEIHMMGLPAALTEHYPQDAERAAKTALPLAPNDPWVLATMGGWNIETVRLTGRILAAALYGAHADEGFKDFRRAIATDPQDPVIAVQYALALTSYGFESRMPEIVAVLDQAARTMPSDAYGRAMHDRAVQLLEMLKRNQRDAYVMAARRYLDLK